MEVKTQLLERLEWLYQRLLSEWVRKTDYSNVQAVVRLAVYGNEPTITLMACVGWNKDRFLKEFGSVQRYVCTESRSRKPEMDFARADELVTQLISDLESHVQGTAPVAQNVTAAPEEEPMKPDSPLARILSVAA